jgi:hypothetical protein
VYNSKKGGDMAKKRTNNRSKLMFSLVVCSLLLVVGVVFWLEDRASAPNENDAQVFSQEQIQDTTTYVTMNQEVILEGWSSDVYETLLTNESIGCWAQVSPTYFGPEGLEAYDEAKLIEGLRSVEDKGYTFEPLPSGDITIRTVNGDGEKFSKQVTSVNAKIQGFETTFYQEYAFIKNDDAYFTSVTLSCDNKDDLDEAEKALIAFEILVN